MNINTLNSKVRTFLLEHCISKRGADAIAVVSGFINSDEVKELVIERRDGKWYSVSTGQLVLSACITIDCLHLSKTTLV